VISGEKNRQLVVNFAIGFVATTANPSSKPSSK
jgi:hypothetical protein